MTNVFDPLTAPAVMPREVRRIDEGGLPTQAMLDWEQVFKSWTVKQTVTLNTKIENVSQETEDGLAAVNTRVDAVVTDQSAMASQITNLQVSYNSISASGQIQFKAIATPVGATAAFGVFLNAGTSYAGMQMIALSGGASTIAFDASSFRLNDSGTATNVFNYSGGVFTFNVPVSVANGNLANSSVTRAWPATGGTSTSVAVNFRGTGFMEIYAQFMGDAAVYTAIDQFVLRVYEDGNPIGDTPISQDQNGTGMTAASRYGATSIVYIRVPSAGNHTYAAEIVKTVTATSLMISGVLIVVKEYSK